jgi:hypothetical protein
LEDVVTRLQEQKNRLSNELAESQSMVKDLAAKLRVITVKDRENTIAQREAQRAQLVELQEELEAVKNDKQKMEQRTQEKFDLAREKAIEQHEHLQTKVRKLESHLASAKAKLDDYRKESFQRESLLRQKLEKEQEAREKLQSQITAQNKELKNYKLEIRQQKLLTNETLAISEAAVMAADRREWALKEKLKEAQDEIATLRANYTARVPMEEEYVSKELSAKVEQLQEQMTSMRTSFQAERQEERQKWGREIAALQEALESARSTPSVAHSRSPVHTSQGRPSILRRIGRKLKP